MGLGIIMDASNQVKLENILQYYENHRKTHYDNNEDIAIENRRREEEQTEICRERQKINDIKTTEEYRALSMEKSNISEELETYVDRLLDEEEGSDNVPGITDAIERSKSEYDKIVMKLIMVLRCYGVNIDFLESKDIDIEGWL
jgi:hypothetical protein